MRRDEDLRLGMAASLVLLFLLMPVAPIQNLLHPSQLSQQPQASGGAGSRELPIQPGQPLPSGTISDSNNWAGVPLDACVPPPTTAAAPLALVAVNGSTTITIDIPQDLFLGVPGGYLIHSYAFFANGSVSAKDSVGNSLSMRLVNGLPKGSVTTSLRANSTAAFESYLVTAAGRTVANITVAYAVMHRNCQSAGLRIAIHGTADWGTKGFGVLKAVMNGGPSRVAGDRASFGNATGTSIAFDWSDSASLSPSFNASDRSVSWKVGKAFTIDPSIVATSATGGATSDVGGLKVCSAGGLYWSWYYDGSYVGFRSSADGASWSPFARVLAATGAESFAVYCSGAVVYYAIVTGVGTVNYRYGTMNPNGNVTWAIGNGSFSTNHAWGGIGDPTTVVDSNGAWWIAVRTTDPLYNRYVEAWKCATLPSCSWSEEKDIATGSTDSNTAGSVLSLASGVGVVYGAPGRPISVVTSGNGGSTWSAAVATAGSCQGLRGSQFTSIGNSILGACDETSGSDTFLKFTYGSGSWTESAMSADNYRQTPVSTDGKSTLVVFEADEVSTDIYYFVSTNLGATWGPRQTLTSNEAYPLPFSATAGAISGSVLPMEWTVGSSMPYDVVFASFPPVVPDAAVSPNSWSKPGLSPYESYFQQNTEYVSPGNGLLTVEQGDFSLPGRGMDLSISAVFSMPYGFRGNSPYEYDNFTLANFGNGWSLNVPWLGPNYLHLADGEAYPYRWAGNVFQVNNATNFELVHNGDGTYDLVLASGTDYHYAANYELLTVADTTGKNVISFSYSSGRIAQTQDTIGRVVTFSYNANGQVASISTGGRTWTYGYNGNDLVSMTDPLGRVTRYQYNDGANQWLLTEIVYPTQGYSTYSYGGALVGTEVAAYFVTGRSVYSSSSPGSLTMSVSTSYSISNGQVVWANATTADGSGHTVGSEDNNFQGAKALSRAYEKDATGAVIRVTEQDYDRNGRVNQTKMISPSGALLASSQTSYDNWGNPVDTSDNLGHQVYFSYANTNSQNIFGVGGFSNSFYPNTVFPNIHDALVGEAQFQNGPGTAPQERYFQYDSAGHLLQSKHLHSGGWLLTGHTYDSYGNILSTTDALGRTTYFQYSPTYSSAYLTQQVTAVGAANMTTSYTYDLATGNQLSVTDPDGFTTSDQYDTLGRLTQTTYPSVSMAPATVRYIYDDANNLLTTINANGQMTKQYYDGLGRLTEVQRYSGQALYSSEYYTDNWDGKVATKTTATGSVYTYAYDSLGRLVKSTNPDGTFSTTSYDDVNSVQTTTDENGHQAQYLFDRDGRLSAVRQYYSPTGYYLTSYGYDQVGNLLSETDANNQVTTYQYDDLNHVVKTTYPDGTSEARAYDAMGNLLTRTDPKGDTTSYAYDSLSRLAKVTYPDASSVSYTYDRDGNVLSMVDPSFTTYYAYDSRDRLTSVTKYVAGAKYSLLYGYDSVGNVVSMTYPDGYALAISYDAMNRVTQLGPASNPFAAFTYTLDDKVSTITYGNGQVATYSYDSRDRPTQILVMAGATKALGLNYTYDGTGNVLSINNENYGYDALNRITSTSFTGGWGSMGYTYDGVGNRLTMTQAGPTSTATTTYSYGAFNRLASAAGGPSSTTYGYDANGNLVTKNDGVHLWTYSYDYDNRLVKVQMGSQTMERMVYDGSGQLTEVVKLQDTTVSLWNGLNTVFQKDLGTGMVTKYFMADGMQVAYMAGSAVYYSHEDILGSVRLVSTSTDATQFSSNYVPYGASYKASGADVFQYAGKPVDPVTGYYNFGARWYDPSTGRFITQDSSSGNQEDGQSLDRYVYADNNPEKNVDPNGHSWFSALSSSISEAAGSLVSAATNAWNSLPPPVQTVVEVAAVTGAILATGGAAAPAILAGAAVMGGLNAALSVGMDVASSRSISPDAALRGFGAGFALGPVAMLAGDDAPTPNQIGEQSELTAQNALAEIGVNAQRGLKAYTPSGTPIAQLDLTDLENGGIYEVKTGWISSVPDPQTVSGPQSVRLSSLIGQTVTLGNPSTGETVVENFQVSSVTYISVTRGANVGGFSDAAFSELSGLGINTMIVNPYGLAAPY